MSVVRKHRTPPRYRCERCGAPFRGWPDNSNRYCSRTCYYGRPPPDPVDLARMRTLWDAGLPLSEIGRQLNVTRSTVAGQVYRHGFPRRRSPIVWPQP